LPACQMPAVRARLELGLPVSGAGEAAGHDHDHGDGDHGFVVLGQGLVVADTAAVFGDPAEGPRHDPAPGQDQESADRVGAFDDVHGAGQDLVCPGQQASGGAPVGSDVAYGAEPGAQRHEQAVRPVAVLDAGGGDHDGQQQPSCVHGDVALAARGLFPVS